MEKINVTFILDHKLMSYRLHFFSQLEARGYNITIVHPGPIYQTWISYVRRFQKLSRYLAELSTEVLKKMVKQR